MHYIANIGEMHHFKCSERQLVNSLVGKALGYPHIIIVCSYIIDQNNFTKEPPILLDWIKMYKGEFYNYCSNIKPWISNLKPSLFSFIDALDLVGVIKIQPPPLKKKKHKKNNKQKNQKKNIYLKTIHNLCYVLTKNCFSFIFLFFKRYDLWKNIIPLFCW